jgi:hypothetical protein
MDSGCLGKSPGFTLVAMLFLNWRISGQSLGFEDVCALVTGSINLTGAAQPQRLELLVASPNYFSMLV